MINNPLFLEQLFVTGGMIAATAFIHATFVASAAAVFRVSSTRVHGALRFFRDVFVLVVLTLWLMLAHIIEMVVWAWLFLRLDLFAGFEAALYFSAISYTTLGFGDVLIDGDWRLLSGACAASGLLMFGLSAAFLLETTAKLRLSGNTH
ncbi:MAG: ion channel [Pseudomonadota bacterium]